MIMIMNVIMIMMNAITNAYLSFIIITMMIKATPSIIIRNTVTLRACSFVWSDFAR